MALGEKAWEGKAWTAIILALLTLSLTFGPTWSMPFLILSGLIVSAVFVVLKKISGNLAPAADDSAPDIGTVVIDIRDPTDAARNSESYSSSSSSSRFKYDVYLNFRGPDSRYGIADFLYRQLAKEGVKVFSDEYEATPGKEIVSQIKGAIKQSRISIAIFSRNSASSRWCLSELAYMWNCKESNGQIIIPIFYDVDPQDVGLQTELFSRDLLKFEHYEVDKCTVERWSEVLKQTAKLKGFTGGKGKRKLGQLVEEVVACVVQLLKEDYQYVNDKLVGIDQHVEEIMRLGVASHEGRATEVRGEEVNVVGICGEPGVGKTTLTKAVFCKMREKFGARCFLEDIRSEGVQLSRQMLIADLKKQIPAPHESSGEEAEEIASLCHNAKVLIVLDGVDKDEQIKALAGKLTWFGPESRIIVTTNKRDVLKVFDDRAVRVHTVKGMDQRHAYKLFCKHAFQGYAAQDVSEYFGLSLDIAKAIGGLPSEIVHQASSLREAMDMTRWRTTLDLLRKRRKK